MKQNVKTNYIFNVAYQLFALLVPLITTPYISRVLSPNGIGIYSYTYSIVAYYVLIAILGSTKYGVIKIGAFQDDIEERSRKFWEIFIFRFICTSLMLAIYLAYCFFMANNKLIAILQSIYIISVIFDISWFFQGMEDFKKIAIRNFIIKLLSIGFIFLFIKNEHDLWKYVFGLAFFHFLGNFVMWLGLPKYLIKVKISSIKPFIDIVIMIQLFIPTVATQVYEMLDKTMIGYITKVNAENGYYEQASKIIRMSLMIITMLSTVMIPKISKNYKNKNFELIKKNMMKSFSFVWFLSIPMIIGIFAISDVLVPVFFGPGYDKVIILLPILSLLFITMGLNSIIGNQYLVATGQHNKYSIMLIIGGTINIIFNAILIPKYYSIGAAISSVLGEFVIMILGFIYLEKTKQFKSVDIIKISYKYMVSGFLMFILLFFIKKYLSFNLIQLLFLICIGSVIYILVLILLKDNLVKEMIDTVINFFKTKKKKV